MRLIYKETRQPVKAGDEVKDIDGDKWEVVRFHEPASDGSNGNVYVQSKMNAHEDSFKPGLLGMEWVEE